jgi:uncharacterized protein
MDESIMSDIDANKKTIMRFFELVTSGQLDEARKLLDKDIEWWILGDLPISGSHNGPDAVMKLYELLGQIIVPPLKLNFTAVTAEEDRVAVEFNSDGMFVTGTPYRNVYHLLLTLKNGKIIQAKEYFDTKYVASVFPM